MRDLRSWENAPIYRGASPVQTDLFIPYAARELDRSLRSVDGYSSVEVKPLQEGGGEPK
jgi:hypothetical protein